MKDLVIGVSAIATSGKDLFFTLLKDKLPQVKRFALADDLKIELQEPIKELYGVDIFDCDIKQKNLLRPFLVFHGNYRREQSNGRYWIERLQNKIKTGQSLSAFGFIPVITDIRYSVYEKDEIQWLKDEMNGVLVHIRKYKLVDGQKVYTQPPNQHEAENDPKIQAMADYKIEWPDAGSVESEYSEKLGLYVDCFIDFLKAKNKI